MSETTKGAAGHTPGQLIANENLKGDGTSAGSWAIWTNHKEPAYIGEAMTKAHAARLVAAWNACEGISTEALTVGAIKTTLQQMGEACDTVAAERDALRAENARLREALATVVASLEWEEKRSGTTYAGYDQARAALTGAQS